MLTNVEFKMQSIDLGYTFSDFAEFWSPLHPDLVRELAFIIEDSVWEWRLSC